MKYLVEWLQLGNYVESFVPDGVQMIFHPSNKIEDEDLLASQNHLTRPEIAEIAVKTCMRYPLLRSMTLVSVALLAF